MRRIMFLLPLVLVAISFGAHAGPPADIKDWVAKLGSQKFKEREAASAALDRRGEDALSALRVTLVSTDPEMRRRASILVERIEGRLETSRLLAGKKIRLVYKDVLVLDAVNDFAAKAGFPIEVEGDRLGVHGRTISLDTGEVTFWEAFALFCRECGLRERVVAKTPDPPPIYLGIIVDNWGVNRANAPVRIALEDAKALPVPIAHCGALRLRVMAPHGELAKGTASHEMPVTVGFILDVSPEPKLGWNGVVGLRITKAIDENGATLSPPQPSGGDPRTEMAAAGGPMIWDGATGMPLMGPSQARQAVARLKPSKQPARTLKEVHGILTVELTAACKLVSVDNLAQAAGKEFKASDGTSFKVLEVSVKDAYVAVRLQVSSTMTAAQAGNGVRVLRAGNNVLVMEGPGPNTAGQDAVFALSAGKAGPMALVKREQLLVENNKGGLDVQYTLKFTKPEGANGPLQLTFSAPRLATVDVPFTLQDVPLVENPQLPPAPNNGLLLAR
jgi:hypothetical protein